MGNTSKSKPGVILPLLVALCMALALMTATKQVKANTFLVTNLDDNGPGSLRQAVLDADSNKGADTINFQAGLTGTIVLTSGELFIIDDLTINGPGASLITVSGNHASRVFEILSGVTAEISGLTISNGTGFDGGGIDNGGSLTLAHMVLSDNHVTASVGGGIFNGATATLTITDSTVSGNSASGGGGIYNTALGTLTIINSTVSGNSASSGGGLDNSTGTMTITNCTVSGNSANLSAGGIANAGGTANISFTTISGNSAPLGAGLFGSAFGPVNIKNSIVANNSSGSDCFNQNPTINATGINFATDGTCPGFTAVTPAQLNLGPLQNNGGPTQTHALLPGSVAIDAATDCTDIGGAVVGVDQRGVSRPMDGNVDGLSRCDAGSYEAVAIFDRCIQDDSNGAILRINTTTGAYQFTDCGGLTVSGTGTITRRGGVINLQHNATDRRVIATIDTSANRATATIQSLSLGRTFFSIIDRNTTNDTCACR